MPARRQVLQAAALSVTGPAAGAGADLLEPESKGPPAGRGCVPPLGPVTVDPDDSRYQDLVRRGHKRYVGSPDYVRVVGSTEQVVQAVQEAVRDGGRVAVRSGGHCLENWVDDASIQVLIDLSGMTQVYYDPERNAFAVEGGADLEQVYRRLFLGWGVTIPAGWCPKVGAGGHFTGGGYGVLSRTHGLVVDHLYGIEVVVVDGAGRASAVVATRDSTGAERELWWAHTGGGGGNFGIVTRFWLRTPGVRGTDPSDLLPKAPASTIDFSCTWPWQGLNMDEEKFARLIRNHGEWCERNSAPGAPGTALYCDLTVARRATDVNLTVGQAHGPDAERLVEDYLTALGAGVGTPINVVRERKPWLTAALSGPNASKLYRLKAKSGYLRKRYDESQVQAIYRRLTAERDPELIIGSVGFASYGGKINTVAPSATAHGHRDAIMRVLFMSTWNDPAVDERYDNWLRALYRDVYRDTGGVPDPRDGAYINYPDNDLADPAHNTSGVPWHRLYYKDNYPRLQRAKSRWDPRNIFTHTLGIQP
ncbi:FAD-linked oxidase [Spongiactinospora gelatinilytica]|uniref:FAD-linked oxidase n=1 Tax=Spongiactinospora gelatinilytica TaxID=2666298 RepID=A0A2W2F282_9ACTN|nr:FAD-linked oxidase [Spongiactinospora gelatinilytica]